MSEFDADNPLQAEILAEKASAYFATIRKMQAAVAALVELDQSRTANPVEETEIKRVREGLLAEAAEQVWFFIIQREAMNLPYYEELFTDYEIPEEVRERMGPKNI